MKGTFTLGKFIEANIPSVHLGTPISTIAKLFQQYGLSQISVIENEQLKGVIYKKYLKRPFLKKSYVARQLMTKNSIKFSIDDSVVEVAKVLQTGFFDDVPVVDAQNRFCGIVRWKNLAINMNNPKEMAFYA